MLKDVFYTYICLHGTLQLQDGAAWPQPAQASVRQSGLLGLK